MFRSPGQGDNQIPAFEMKPGQGDTLQVQIETRMPHSEVVVFAGVFQLAGTVFAENLQEPIPDNVVALIDNKNRLVREFRQKIQCGKWG
jgi:hypothetical protein